MLPELHNRQMEAKRWMEEKNPFPWNNPAVGLLSLKGSDSCEAALFPSRPRATAGGEIINMAGKVKLG